MQIVDSAYHAPGVCFICEQRPVEGQRAVDTLCTFDPGIMTSLNGRKYICEGCVATVAKLFGFVTMGEHNAVTEKATEAFAEVKRLAEENKSLGDFHELL